MRRHNVEGLAVHKSVFFQQLKRLRQHPFADAFDLAAQFAEPHRVVLQRNQYQHAPAAGDVIEQRPRRAIRAQHIGFENFFQRIHDFFHTYIFVCTSFLLARQ